MTQDEREEMRRHFGVLTEDLRSQIEQVAEGVTANGQAIRRFEEHTTHELAAVHNRLNVLDAFRVETARNFAEIRSEAEAFRVETARNFAEVRSEAEAFRDQTARNFAEVRSEAEAFRDQTARNFAEVRSEAEAFRVETARNFAAVRSEMAGSRTGPLSRRPRSRRRPN
jgi:hypothetical protein